MYELIDSIHDSEDYCYIDFIPCEAPDVSFLELEEYFESTYLPLFAEKICRIALKLIYLYPCEIYVPKSYVSVDMEYEISFDVNIRNNTPAQLAFIIKNIVSRDVASMQILFTEPQFLMSIDGEFSVSFHQPTKEVLKVIEQLVTQEGLFLKHNIPTDENVST